MQSAWAFGQIVKCGTHTIDTLTPEDRAFAIQAQQYAHKNGIIRTIPVVVHVVYAQEKDDGNISDAQIASQFAVLNHCFRGQAGGVDTEIEFCLAGINRIQSPGNVNISGGANKTLKTLIYEDPHQFLNCWVVGRINDGDLNGFSTFPADLDDAPELDGIVMSHSVFGTIGTAADNDPYHLGKVMVHEIGHWLNLHHVFLEGCEAAHDCRTEGDLCCDTPPQRGVQIQCNQSSNTCHRDDPDLDDPIENYMGYGQDECVHAFTSCQSNRMNLTLDAFRRNAWFTGSDCPQVKRDLRCSLYPNPFTNTANLRAEIVGKATPLSIDVFDLQGRLLDSVVEKQERDPGIYNFPIEFKTPGMYLIRVWSPWKVEWFKAISR